jgi:hypothetical protein
MTGSGVKMSGQDLTSQLSRELSLARQHSDNARTLADQLEKLHLEEKESPKAKTPKSKSKSKSPSRRKESGGSSTKSPKHVSKSPRHASKSPKNVPAKTKEVLRVKLSGGPDAQRFEVGTQAQTRKKLDGKYPGRLEWTTSKVQIVIIPNNVSKASKTSAGKLGEGGREMHYDEFVAWMSETK